MRKALPVLALAVPLLSACGQARLSQEEIQADYARQTKLEADWARANSAEGLSPQEQRYIARYRQTKADELYCQMQAQMAGASADNWGIIYGAINAAAHGNQVYGTCMQMKAAQRD